MKEGKHIILVKSNPFWTKEFPIMLDTVIVINVRLVYCIFCGVTGYNFPKLIYIFFWEDEFLF